MNLQEKFMVMVHGKFYTGEALSVNGYLLPHTIELDQSVDEYVSYNEVLNICDYFDQSNLFETEVLPEHIYDKEENKKATHSDYTQNAKTLEVLKELAIDKSGDKFVDIYLAMENYKDNNEYIIKMKNQEIEQLEQELNYFKQLVWDTKIQSKGDK